MGGLGIHNLKFLNNALRMRWRWLERERPARAWKGLQFDLPTEAEDLFQAACRCVVGKGDRIMFWQDRWLQGKSPAQIAPTLLAFVTARGARKRTVAAAIHENRWISDTRKCTHALLRVLNAKKVV
jgi:hypothetical protein